MVKQQQLAGQPSRRGGRGAALNGRMVVGTATNIRLDSLFWRMYSRTQNRRPLPEPR